MSQQINLLLPELRPQQDWLALPLVAGAAVAGVVLVAVLAAWGSYRVQGLNAAQAQVQQDLTGLQQQLQALGQTLAARRPDAALQAEIERLNEAVREREDALREAEKGKIGAGGGHAELMRGFARQAMEGVWLTGFSAAGQDVEIRGRLADPALLPKYIRRLNGDAALQGRRFSALDMKDGEAGDAKPEAVSATATANTPAPVYTDFVLRGILGKTEDKAP